MKEKIRNFFRGYDQPDQALRKAVKDAFEKSEQEVDRLSRMSFEDAEREIGVRDTRSSRGFLNRKLIKFGRGLYLQKSSLRILK